MTPEKLEVAKSVGDGLSIGTVVGALVGFLPEMAALLTVVWTAIRIFETETIQRLLGRKKP